MYLFCSLFNIKPLHRSFQGSKNWGYNSLRIGMEKQNALGMCVCFLFYSLQNNVSLCLEQSPHSSSQWDKTNSVRQEEKMYLWAYWRTPRMEIRNWMKGTSEQRGPCRVGTGALFVHRRSAWPGPGRALLLWVPRVGWSEEKWPRCPTTLCDLPEDCRRLSAGPAACSLLAVLGREGHTRKTLKFLAFTSVTNVYYFAPMCWEERSL